MAAAPILTQLTTFSIDDDAGSPVTINGVRSISGLGAGTASEIDVTTLASTAKEFRMGLQDFGTFTMEFIWNQDDLGQVEMLDAQAQQEQRTFIMTLPSSTANVATFECFVLSMSADVGTDGVVMGSATIRITGAIAWT